jgi:hypothetical protein
LCPGEIITHWAHFFKINLIGGVAADEVYLTDEMFILCNETPNFA